VKRFRSVCVRVDSSSTAQILRNGCEAIAKRLRSHWKVIAMRLRILSIAYYIAITQRLQIDSQRSQIDFTVIVLRLQRDCAATAKRLESDSAMFAAFVRIHNRLRSDCKTIAKRYEDIS
jgi:hypothetical protein